MLEHGRRLGSPVESSSWKRVTNGASSRDAAQDMFGGGAPSHSQSVSPPMSPHENPLIPSFAHLDGPQACPSPCAC